MRLPQIINEIKNLRQEPTHRSCLTIYRLLENNKALFLEKMEADNFNHVFAGFETLSDVSPKDYNTQAYKNDFEKAHGLLMFYLDRIL